MKTRTILVAGPGGHLPSDIINGLQDIGYEADIRFVIGYANVIHPSKLEKAIKHVDAVVFYNEKNDFDLPVDRMSAYQKASINWLKVDSGISDKALLLYKRQSDDKKHHLYDVTMNSRYLEGIVGSTGDVIRRLQKSKKMDTSGTSDTSSTVDSFQSDYVDRRILLAL